MTLTPFLNRHAGETAWLFGKGPSLATFDFNKAGPLRAAINDVIAHVPSCAYGFANDGVRQWVDVYKQGQTLFQPERGLQEYDCRESIKCDVVAFPDTYAARRGTLCSAIQILKFFGVSTIHLVGIDGGKVHASGFEFRTRIQSFHRTAYDEIRNDAVLLADELGIDLIFHNQDHIMTDGKITMRITRNCFVSGEPMAEGEIKSFPPLVARDLIACRGAEVVTDKKPEIPVREAAALQTPIETASLPPATKKQR